MAIVLSLLAAVTYGAADFVGGFVTKRVNVLVVVFLSQAMGTVPFLLSFPLLNDAPYTRDALLWGAAAGIGGGAGVILLYAGLAAGRMSIVAPITAVEAACVPVLVGLATGEDPGGLALIGVVVAIVAVALISSSADAPGSSEASRRGRLPAGVLAAMGAGIGFGAFFIFLDLAGDGTGMWPLVGSRAASLSLAGVALLLTMRRVPVDRRALPGIATAGALDFGANIFYLLATRHGLLSLVAVITSMYPASTVLLARVVLKERLLGPQIAGIALAGAGVVLIAAG